MVERLVANEKVEGSSPFARSIINMKKIIILVFFTLVSNFLHAKETLIECKFVWGDETEWGKKKKTYEQGDLNDIYLKINFKKEKVIDHPFNVYGVFGIPKTSIIFETDQITWSGQNKYISTTAILNRKTGDLMVRYWEEKKRRGSQEEYACSKGKLKFLE